MPLDFLVEGSHETDTNPSGKEPSIIRLIMLGVGARGLSFTEPTLKST